ncbi:hypothetical protein CC2G_010528 [Coprinopsis cinerea AmutBmut pab1-1]|nr:hypothetical protein CC2G_010528 [Coprinopsis cinerea AmutBmut pab1-1]
MAEEQSLSSFTSHTISDLSHYLEGAPEPLDFPPLEKLSQIPPTDYAAFVLDTLTLMNQSQPSGRIDQEKLRRCIQLASSFLLTDHGMNPDTGTQTWGIGLSRLVDVIVALHKRNELEPATLFAANKACKDCWVTSASFRGLEECRSRVRENGTKLRNLMDPNGKTYKGHAVS